MAEVIFEINDALHNEETDEYVIKPKYIGELVRCGDCKCFDIATNGVNGFCTKLGIPFDVYDYCSLGEARENGNLELQ